jgi:hypothetical protein
MFAGLGFSIFFHFSHEPLSNFIVYPCACAELEVGFEV